MKTFISKIILLYAVVLIGMSSNVKADEYVRFNNLLIEDGLSQGTINAVFQDSKGYLWFGSNNGLNKYNGYEFTIYKNKLNNKNTLSSDYIFEINEDIEGNIWVGTMEGVSKISSDNKITNYSISNNTGVNVPSIIISKNNDIIVGTGSGIYIYDKNKDAFIKYIEDYKLTSTNINDMFEDNEENLWVASEFGLNKVNSKTKEVEKYFGFNDNNLYSVYCDERYAWVGSYQSGAYRLDRITGDIEHYEPNENSKNSIAGDLIMDIVVDSRNNLWFATNRGLSMLDQENCKFTNYTNNITDSNSLVNNSVLSIMEDSTGNFWAGTYSGVSNFNPYTTISHYKHNPFDNSTLSENMMKGLYEDEDGYIWVGTNESGVDILNGEFKKIYNLSKDTTDNKLFSNTITGINGYKQYVFLSTNLGLNIIDKTLGKLYRIGKDNGLLYNNIQYSLVDSYGNLWVAASDGVSVLEKGGQTFNSLESIFKDFNISNYYTRVLYEDSRKNIWIGNFVSGGLLKINSLTKEIKHYTTENSNLSNNTIRSIVEDSNGNLWIGTSLGINKYIYDIGDFLNYTSEDGLYNDTIYGILLDKDDNPWVSTNLGISKYDVNNNTFTNYTVLDGLQSNEFNGLSYLKLKNGQFMFGGINGLNVFDPQSLTAENVKPKLLIDKLKINGVEINTINDLKLKHSEKNILIKFFVDNFKNASIYKYYYKEDDGKWLLLDSNSILFSNLSPGDYKYKFKVQNNSGIFSDEIALDFQIAEIWWKSNTVKVLSIIILIILIFYYKNKVKILNAIVDTKTKYLKDEMQKNEELYDKVIKLERTKNNYFVNLSHELRTPLNVIYSTQQLVISLNRSVISKDKLDEYMHIVGRNSKRLLKIINDIIDTSKIENGAYNLNVKENDIVYLVEESVLSLKGHVEGKGITLVVDPEFEEKIIKCDYDLIERCIINLVSNAAKFTKEGGTITVNIKEENSKLIIEVIDTGIGIEEKYHSIIFDRFNQIVDADSENKGGSGLGLAITKQIVELHKGDIKLESELGKGCKFTISLPI